MRKWVYLFTEGNAGMRELLGGKGANLAEMTKKQENTILIRQQQSKKKQQR